MTVRDLVVYPDPVLKKVAEPVGNIKDKKIADLVKDMVDTMYANDGLGLAAPQIGESLRIIVLDVSQVEINSSLLKLINPQIVDSKGNIIWEEGCLSLPGINEEIERKEYVKVRAYNPDGEQIEIEGEGLFAVALQHEIDHLDGILLVDYLSSIKRQIIKRKLKKFKEKQYE